jgi:glycosyltransferase involved in cell wall biosynthesis
MKICIVGPGLMEIPPKGWGACEILIHDYRCVLESFGHEIFIVNTPDKHQIIKQINTSRPDFVHIQYDDHIDIANHLLCKNIAITTHFAYLEQPHRWGGYANIFNRIVNTPHVNIFSLSEAIGDIYKKYGVAAERIYITPNGVRTDLFKFKDQPNFPNKSIYLAKIDYRKRQHLFQHIEKLYFVGRQSDLRFDITNERYLGEWDKIHLYENLTNYANLVLLSDGEAHPLVCLEALSAGLGLVISQYSTANLDTNLPFIDIIPEDKMKNTEYITNILKKNRETSISLRQEIKEYANSFSWEKMVEKNHYISIKKILNNNGVRT